jgi:hypothetical protein
MSDPSYLVQTVIDLGRNGMTMDVKETLDFQNAIKPWIRRAVAHIKTDPNLEALVRKCLNETGDVRIVHYVRGECITVEACDYQKGEISEIFRQYLAPSMPSDAGGRRCKGAMIGKVALQHTGMDTLTQSEAGTTAALRSVYEARSTNTR